MLGFPILGVEWQKMENPDFRKAMGMKPDQKGVRIRRLDPTSPESEVLKPSDIILSFDEVHIANDGTGKSVFIIYMAYTLHSFWVILFVLYLLSVLKKTSFISCMFCYVFIYPPYLDNFRM